MPAVLGKPAQSNKKERIDLRIPAETKEVIKNAAQIKGMNTTDFIISAAYDAAQNTILGREIMHLNAEQSRRVAERLINPGEPSEALKRLMSGEAATKTTR